VEEGGMSMAISLSRPHVGVADSDTRSFLAFAQSRDARALEPLVSEAAPRAFRQAYRMLGNSADAEDAVLEALLQLVRTAGKFDGTISFGAWLGRLVHIAALRVARSRRAQRRRDRHAPPPTTPAGHDPETDELIRASVHELPEKLRVAVDLHYFAGLSQDQTAQALGLSVNAFGVRLHRAREKLRMLLRSHGAELTTAGLVGALSAMPAPANSATIGAKIIALAVSGAQLPATTLPLSLLDRSAMLLSAHPIACVSSLIIAIAGVGVSIENVHAVAPQPAVKKIAWTGVAKELLPYIDPKAKVTIACDLDALRASSAQAKPTSLLSDPAAQSAVSYIAQQLRAFAMLTPDVPPIDVITHAHGMVVSAHENPIKLHVANYNMVIDLGDAAAISRPWFDGAIGREFSSPQAGSIAGFDGWLVNLDKVDMFGGFSHNLFTFSHRSTFENDAANVAARKPETPSAALSMRYDSKNLFADIDRLDTRKLDPLALGAWLPNWRTDRPVLDVTVDCEHAVLTTTTEITGVSALPLRPLSRDLRALMTGNRLLEFAVGVELKHLRNSLALYNAPRPLEESGWEISCQKFAGCSFQKVLDVLDGDIVLLGHRSQPIPTGTMVVGLRSVSNARDIIAELARRNGMSDDGPDRWTVLGPMGLLTVEIRGTALAISTDAEHLDADLTAFTSALPSTNTAAAHIHVDLPALANDYFSILQNMIPAAGVEMETTAADQLDRFAWSYSSAGSFAKIKAITRLSEYTSEDTHEGTPPIGHVQKYLAPALTKPWAEVLDSCVTIFGRVRDDYGNCESAIIYRLPDGYCTSTVASRPFLSQKGARLTKEQLTEQLAGLEKLLGPSLDDLQIMPLRCAEFPRFDRKWLPDVATLVRNLAPYELTIRTDGDGIAISESGLPILPCAAAMISGMAYSVHSERRLSSFYKRALDGTYGSAVYKRHRDKIAVLTKVATFFPSSNAEPRVTPSARFIESGLLSLEEFACFFDGRVPTAAELDTLGTPADDYWVKWIVPLEPGWWAHTGRMTLNISSDPAEHLSSFNAYFPSNDMLQQRMDRAVKPVRKPASTQPGF
jgi:RNA polymerase sigma-70 factor, ECF subfamily